MDPLKTLGIARFLRTCLLDSLPEPVEITDARLGDAEGGPALAVSLQNHYQADLIAVSFWCAGAVRGTLRALRIARSCTVSSRDRALLVLRLPPVWRRGWCDGLDGLQIEDVTFADDTLWVAGAAGGIYATRVCWD